MSYPHASDRIGTRDCILHRQHAVGASLQVMNGMRSSADWMRGQCHAHLVSARADWANRALATREMASAPRNCGTQRIHCWRALMGHRCCCCCGWPSLSQATGRSSGAPKGHCFLFACGDGPSGAPLEADALEQYRCLPRRRSRWEFTDCSDCSEPLLSPDSGRSKGLIQHDVECCIPSGPVASGPHLGVSIAARLDSRYRCHQKHLVCYIH